MRTVRMYGTVLALIMAACLSPLPTPSAPTPAPMPTGMVDVGGHDLLFESSDRYGPAVILPLTSLKIARLAKPQIGPLADALRFQKMYHGSSGCRNAWPTSGGGT
jgi:hypothetical protein